MSKVKTIIVASVVTIIALTCLGIGIAVNEQNEVKKPSLGELTPLIPDVEIEMPEEEYIPQSFAPTNSFLDEGEIVYYGWKVDRDDPIVEEPVEPEVPETPVEPETPEQPEEPEEKPNKPHHPGFKPCKHGFINPIFCWICGGY